MFKNCKKNDELYYVEYSLKNREGKKVIVTRVSGDFIYVKHISISDREIKHKFRINDGYEIVDCGGNGSLYLSEYEYINHLNSIRIKKYIENTINDSRVKISLSDLKLIEQIILTSVNK